MIKQIKNGSKNRHQHRHNVSKIDDLPIYNAQKIEVIGKKLKCDLNMDREYRHCFGYRNDIAEKLQDINDALSIITNKLMDK